MNQFIMLGCLWLGACATAFSQQQTNGVNYQLGPIPSVHKPLAENSVPMGNIQTFEGVKLDLPITSGPYEPTWKSIEANYPGTLDTLWTAVGRRKRRLVCPKNVRGGDTGV